MGLLKYATGHLLATEATTTLAGPGDAADTDRVPSTSHRDRDQCRCATMCRCDTRTSTPDSAPIST